MRLCVSKRASRLKGYHKVVHPELVLTLRMTVVGICMKS
jgi:hypothetical protein